MDGQMQSTVFSDTEYPVWDYLVVNGIVPIIDGPEEEYQEANIMAFLQLGTIPQLPNQGSPWVQMLIGESDFATLDNQIRNNLIAIGRTDFNPSYDLINDRLVATVKRVTS